MTDKVRENKLRRMADRRGFKLYKSRRRDPYAKDYGLYYLTDETLHREELLDLNAVEAVLKTEGPSYLRNLMEIRARAAKKKRTRK